MATSTISGIQNVPDASIEDFVLEVLPLAPGDENVEACMQRLTADTGVWMRKIDGFNIGAWVAHGTGMVAP
jgi:hypothetical protein